jgi:hypothetical protein
VDDVVSVDQQTNDLIFVCCSIHHPADPLHGCPPPLPESRHRHSQGTCLVYTSIHPTTQSTDPPIHINPSTSTHPQGSALPRGVYTFDAHPLTQPASAAALPSRSTFKTYSPDIWKKDKDVLFLQVRCLNGWSMHGSIH